MKSVLRMCIAFVFFDIFELFDKVCVQLVLTNIKSSSLPEHVIYVSHQV